MLRVLDYNTKHFALIRKIALWISAILLALAAFFLYVSNVPVDAATEEMLAVLDVLAIVFACIAPFAIAVIVTYIVLQYKQRKELLKHTNKKKVHIHVFDVINFAWMAIFCLLCVYPIVYVVVGSFNQGADYAKGGVYLLPRLFTFENYKVVLENTELYHSYLVTIGRTVIGTLSALCLRRLSPTQ